MISASFLCVYLSKAKVLNNTVTIITFYSFGEQSLRLRYLIRVQSYEILFTGGVSENNLGYFGIFNESGGERDSPYFFFGCLFRRYIA